MKTTLMFLLLALCALFSIGQDTKPVFLKNTQSFTIDSKIVNNETFTIQVCLPMDYQKEKRYPVVYVLDADRSFELTNGIIDLLTFRMGSFKSEILDIIVVGIMYNKTAEVWWHKRSRDYTPTRDTVTQFGKYWPIAGGADVFLDFIQKELKPTIANMYSVDETKSGIIGTSFGGLLATYALVTRSDMFDRYIIVVPSLIWDNEIVSKLEADYSQKNNDLNKHVYIALASIDSPFLVINPTKKVVEALESRKYPSLKLFYEFCENETHISVYPRALASGLKKCYGNL